MILRTGTDHLIEDSQISFRELARTVVLTVIPQRNFAVFTKALGDTIDGGVMDVQDGLDFPGAASTPKIEDDQIA